MSFKAGFVGILGQPNAGKSTLVNLLVGEKVAAVTDKPQTTRQRVQGIMNTDSMQAILVDAPGVIHAEKGLNAFLQTEYEDVMKNSDVILAVLSVDEDHFPKLEKIIELAANSGKPWAAVITKVDMVEKSHRRYILEEKLQKREVAFAAISALDEPELARERLTKLLESLLPEVSAPLFDGDLFTTHSMRDLTREIIREKCFLNLEREVPYGLAVVLRQFKEEDVKIPQIYADIMVERESHKAIVVGQGGARLKKIGMAARQEIEKLMGGQVFLNLHVVAHKNWTRDPRVMKELGYVQIES